MKLLKKEKGQIVASTQIDCHADGCWGVAVSNLIRNSLMFLGLVKDFKPVQDEYQSTVVPKH